MNNATVKNTIFLLQDVLELIPGNIYWKDKNGIYRGCSHNMAHIIGFSSPDEIIGKSAYDIMPRELAEHISCIDKEIIATGKKRTLEEEGLDNKGTKAVYLTTKSPLFNDTGKIVGLIGVSIDATENKKEQLELLERHKQYEFTLENIIALMPLNVYWMDKNGVLLGCSDNQLNTLGLKSRTKFVGKKYIEVLCDSGYKEVEEINEQILNTGQELVLEEIGLNDKGEEATYLTKKIPLLSKDKQITGLLGVSFDITDRKRAEEYRIKHEAAQKVINFTNLMAGSIAHELRTPLAGIKINMENLQNMEFDKIPPQLISESLKQMSGAIIKTINATSHVIDDMLLKVRSFATGKTHHKEFEEISITADIEHLLETYPFKDNEQGLAKTSYGARFKYIGDKNLTAHILSNLTKNALHAINECDKPNASITIETKVEGDFNVLIFRDTAIGIPKDFVAKIFDQFETKKTTHGGTGLGLAFCKMVMEDCYGGSITCNSEERKYTEFVLKFPKL